MAADMLDLDALEQQYDLTTNGHTLKDIRPLIQRLREAEAGYDNSKLMSENYVKDLQQRVELLERVREAAAVIVEVSHRIALVGFYDGTLSATGREFYATRDMLATALAAVEENA